MEHVVVVHVTGIGGPTPHTSPIYASLDWRWSNWRA